MSPINRYYYIIPTSKASIIFGYLVWQSTCPCTNHLLIRKFMQNGNEYKEYGVSSRSD